MKAFVIAAVALLVTSVGLSAQDQLSAAKDLYASAAYEDALSTLSRLDGAASAPDVARQAKQYRAFCLYALGRTREAETVAESIVRAEPLARLDSADASPRLEAMFTDVRKRLLPSLVRERFRSARTALDQEKYLVAEPQFVEARLMIAEAAKIGVKDDYLSDLDVLVDGFLQLIHSSTDPRPSAAAEPVGGGGPSAAPSSAPAPAPGRAPSSPARAAANVPEVYSLGDEGVSLPVALVQRMPDVSPEMLTILRARQSSGLLDVLIDENGGVLEATIRRSLHPKFDTLVVEAARRWKYRPAMKDGVAVRFVKTISLIVP